MTAAMPNQDLIGRAVALLRQHARFEGVPEHVLEHVLMHPDEAVDAFQDFIYEKPWGLFNKIVDIDRSVSFNPGLYGGTLCGFAVIEDDKRSLMLTTIQLSKLRLASCIRPDESIRWREWDRRALKSPDIPLDARLWEIFKASPDRIPGCLKPADESSPDRYISFRGTLLGGEGDSIGYPMMYWDWDSRVWEFSLNFSDGEPVTDDTFSLEYPT